MRDATGLEVRVIGSDECSGSSDKRDSRLEQEAFSSAILARGFG
jgi:hypothetical protein